MDQTRAATATRKPETLAEFMNQQRVASVSAVDRAYQSTKMALTTNKTSIEQAFKFERETFGSADPISKMHTPYSVVDMSRTMCSPQLRRALDNTT